MTSAYAQSPSCPTTYGAWPAPATLTSAVSRSQCVQNDCSMRWGRVIVRTPTIACEERAFAVPPRCLACRWVSRHFRHHDRIVLDSGEKLAYPSKPVRFAQTTAIPTARRMRSNRMRMANCSMQPAQFRKSALGRAARGLLSCYHMPLRRRLQFAARLGDDLPSAP